MLFNVLEYCLCGFIMTKRKRVPREGYREESRTTVIIPKLNVSSTRFVNLTLTKLSEDGKTCKGMILYTSIPMSEDGGNLKRLICPYGRLLAKMSNIYHIYSVAVRKKFLTEIIFGIKGTGNNAS